MKVEDVFGQITAPTQIQSIGSGAAGISNLLSKIIELDMAFKTTGLNEKAALSLLISEL